MTKKSTLDLARDELNSIPEILDANDPTDIAKKAVNLSVMLSSVNVQVAAARQANAKHYQELLGSNSATAAGELKRAHQTYLTLMAAEGISEALKEAIYSLRKLAEIAASERKINQVT